MTDTPETDAAVIESNGQWSFVLKETCQRLERERDKAREDATNYFAKIGELESERDDALAQIVQAECRAERFCQERDEAKADLEFRRELYIVQTERLERIERERNQWRECADRMYASSGWSDEWPKAIKFYRKLRG